jgi:uncharacterized protein
MIWVLAALGLYLLLLTVVAWVSLHPPRIPIFWSPAMVGAPQEEVRFPSSDDVPLAGWWVESESPRAVAVLGHGYIMNRSELAPLAFRLWQEGISSLLFEFRGHGRSGRARCTLGRDERHDVHAAIAYARARHPGVPVILIGSSMGAVAATLALEEDPGGADLLVLDSAYSRLAAASVGWWRFVGGTALAVFLGPTALVAIPLAGFNPFRVDVAKALRSIGPKPILFFHGRCDLLAPPAECERNYAAAEGPKEVVWFEDCNHSEGRWIHSRRYERSLFAFLDLHLE